MVNFIFRNFCCCPELLFNYVRPKWSTVLLVIPSFRSAHVSLSSCNCPPVCMLVLFSCRTDSNHTLREGSIDLRALQFYFYPEILSPVTSTIDFVFLVMMNSISTTAFLCFLLTKKFFFVSSFAERKPAPWRELPLISFCGFIQTYEMCSL